MDEKLRIFLSFDIEDEGIISKIQRVQNGLDKSAAKMKLVEGGNIHFTWRFLGDTSIAQIEKIYNALQKLEFRPFTITVESVGVFPNLKRPRIIWVGVGENAQRMIELKTRVDEKLAEIGYPIEKKFTPHATIARIRFVKNNDQLLTDLERVSNEKFGSLNLDHIRITKSTLTPIGPIYETLYEIRGHK